MAVVNYTNGGSAANALANQARPYGITPSDRLQTEQLPMSVLANLLAGNLPGIASNNISVDDPRFGAVGDGVTDDTVAIQAAIDYATGLNGIVEVLFTPGSTYVTGRLRPRSGVTLNLQGATLFLKNDTDAPIIYDGGVGGGGGSNFGVINGTIDCNQDNNNGLNVVGGVWLTGWTHIRFENLTIQECFRIGLNLIGCSFVTVTDYTFRDSGVVGAFFAYALNFEKSTGTSRYIFVRNVNVSNVIGFGVHFFGCEDFDAANLNFDTMSFGANLAIAITFTDAKRGVCNNVQCNDVDGDNIEINGCADLSLANYKITGAGNRALLTGAPAYGYCTNIRISNFADSATGGSFSAALTYLTNCTLDGLLLEKGVSTTVGLASMANNVVRRSTIGSTIGGSPALVAYTYFLLEDVRFTDYTIRRLSQYEYVVSGSETIASAAALNLPISDIVSATAFAFNGSVAGTLRTLSRFTGSLNQGSYQTCEVLVNDFGTAANLSTVTQVNNAVTRALTITGDAANEQIVLTNGSGVELFVVWVLELVTFT